MKYVLISIMSLFFISAVSAAGFFGKDDTIIWESGINRYIKLEEQDSNKYGLNQHPITLKPDEIKNALSALKVPEETLFGESEKTLNVFTFQQINLLSKEVVKAIKIAKPNQDIVFALESSVKKLLGLKDKRYVAGRVFYKDDKLNIIMGEHDFFRSEAFESEYDRSGQAASPYNLNHGKRTKATKIFKGVFLDIKGIDNKRFNEIRHDWFVIDLKVASNDYIAQKNKRENPVTKYDKQLEKEAAKLAKQRREMRAEMARMRKEVQSVSSNKSSSAKSIEERIGTLDQLLSKKLITQDEYDAKREKILNDI